MEEDKKNYQDDYSLYNYFYGHPSILLATITAIATVFSLIANFVYYNLELHYLEYWGFSTSHFHFSIAGSASAIILGIILFIVFLPIRAFYSSFASVFRNNHLYAKRQTYIIKAIMKKYKAGERRKKTTANERHCFESDDDLLSEIKNIRRDVRELRWLVLKQFLPFYVATALLGWFVFSLYSSLSSVFVNQSLLVFLYILIIVFFFLKKVINKMISDYKKAKKEIMSNFPIIDSEETKARYRIKKYSDFKIHEFLSNRIIINGLLSFIVSFSVFIFCFVVLVDRGYKNQKSLRITEMNDKPFVVIYRDSESYYLNEAEINNGKISISDEVHVIIQTDYLEVISETFRDVEKVKRL